MHELYVSIFHLFWFLLFVLSIYRVLQPDMNRNRRNVCDVQSILIRNMRAITVAAAIIYNAGVVDIDCFPDWCVSFESNRRLSHDCCFKFAWCHVMQSPAGSVIHTRTALHRNERSQEHRFRDCRSSSSRNASTGRSTWHRRKDLHWLKDSRWQTLKWRLGFRTEGQNGGEHLPNCVCVCEKGRRLVNFSTIGSSKLRSVDVTTHSIAMKRD